mgnify:FL=1
MKKVNKQITVIVLIALLLVAVIVTVYFIAHKKQSQNDNSTTDNSGDTASTVLQYGSRGNEVKRLQEFLNTQLSLMVWRGYPTYNGQEIKQLTVDGIFGARTQAAVEWYFNSKTVLTNQF